MPHGAVGSEKRGRSVGESRADPTSAATAGPARVWPQRRSQREKRAPMTVAQPAALSTQRCSRRRSYAGTASAADAAAHCCAPRESGDSSPTHCWSCGCGCGCGYGSGCGCGCCDCDDACGRGSRSGFDFCCDPTPRWTRSCRSCSPGPSTDTTTPCTWCTRSSATRTRTATKPTRASTGRARGSGTVKGTADAGARPRTARGVTRSGADGEGAASGPWCVAAPPWPPRPRAPSPHRRWTGAQRAAAGAPPQPTAQRPPSSLRRATATAGTARSASQRIRSAVPRWPPQRSIAGRSDWR